MGPQTLFWRLFTFTVAATSFAVVATILLLEQHSTSSSWTMGMLVVISVSIVAFVVIAQFTRPLEQLVVRVREVSPFGSRAITRQRNRDEFDELQATFIDLRNDSNQRAEQAEMLARQLSTVLDGMKEGVIAVDADERIVIANSASRELLDATVTKLVGKHLFEVTRNKAIHDAVAHVLTKEPAFVSEFSSLGPSRRTLVIQATRLPGEPCPGLVLVLQDVSELRRLENLRRDFVANVSHELKTPLASIKAYSETLRLGAIHDDAHNLEFVGRIETEAERLHQLILDLLHLARVETGKEAFEFEEVDVADAVGVSISRLAQAATAKSINLTFADGPVASVRADFDGLLVILDNLVSNAINYTPSGGSVRVFWDSDESFVTIHVKDSGIGIALIHHERIFERFYRVDRARSRELGGTGLGLAIVKHLTIAFGGAISLRSEMGVGSTFSVRLPKFRVS